jgi:hypothetical protein
MIVNKMNCKICGSESEKLFKAQVLNKYMVIYYQCLHCGFIQTENPYWLTESYENSIASVDTGIVTRNLVYGSIVDKIIRYSFNKKGKFLDYGGGYGLFVRLMRDKGFDFYWYDKYSENLFSKCFSSSELANDSYFELITSFEVFEHLTQPMEEISKILASGKSLLFSTELLPQLAIKTVDDWWYFSPDTGQHIAFYSEKSLSCLALKLGCNFYTNGSNLHLFTINKFRTNPIKIPYLYTAVMDKLLKRNFNNPNSLIKNDFIFALSKLLPLK